MSGTGLLVLGLGYVLNYLGVNADSSEVAGWADALLKVLGLVWMLWGQLRRKDLQMGLWRV